jgi:hypothetical protein
MQELTTNTRWDDPNHKAAPGREHAELELVEANTGHSWERTPIGEIKLHPMDEHCQGPVCRSCGFAFCVECGIPDAMFACLGTQAQITNPQFEGVGSSAWR